MEAGRNIPIKDDSRGFMISWKHFNEVWRKFNNTDLFGNTRRWSVPIKFVIDPYARFAGQYDRFTGAITINLESIIKWKTEGVISIDYMEMRNIISHELIHHKQDMMKSPHAVNPFRSKKPYFNRGHEQGAWGAEAVEKIRQDFEPFNLKGHDLTQHVVRYLRNHGLTDARLKVLKISNLKAWKKIMKRALLATLYHNKYNARGLGI